MLKLHKGYLFKVFKSSESEPCHGELYFMLDEGLVFPVEFQNAEKAEKTPQILNIALSGYLQQDRLFVPDIPRWYTVLETEAPGLRDTTTKHILLAYKIDSDKVVDEEDIKRIYDSTVRRAKECESHLILWSGHKWAVRVEAMVFQSDCRGAPWSYCGTEILNAYGDQKVGLGLEDFYPNYLHVIGEPMQSLCGQATLGGSRGATYIANHQSLCGTATTLHELYHNFGLGHGRKLQPDGTIKEYGDSSTMMGNSTNRKGLNAINLIHLGLADRKDIKHVTKNAEVFLCPLELNSSAMRSGEEHIVILPGTTPGRNNVHLSMRKTKGHPEALTHGSESMVFIHEENAAGSLLIGAIDVDSEFVYSDANGNTLYTIYNEEYQDETCKIFIKFAGDPSQPEPVEFNTGLPPAPGTEAPNRTMNGTWYNPNQPRQGLEVRVRDGKFSLIWYTYRSRNIREFYVTDAMPVHDAATQFPLYITDNGTFQDPAGHDVIKAGVGQIYFINDNKAVFNFRTEQHGRGSIELDRLSRSTHPQDGWFWNPDRDGEGFTFHDIGDGNKIMYWYTYDKRKHPNGYWLKDQQWWYAVLNDEGVGNLIELNDAVPLGWSEPTETIVGKVKVDFLGVDEQGLDKINLVCDHTVHGHFENEAQRLF